MIRTNRFFVALLVTLGLAVALLGCDSSSDGESGPLRILITNDDGVKAAGIDAVVEALKDDPNNEIIVCAPAEQQSGSGDQRTPTPPPLEAVTSTTLSGYPATAVMGFPADAVIYALGTLYPAAPPHVVLSGINEGQNVGDVSGVISQTSGTVGAAKTAACDDVPALASSQGNGPPHDYPSGVAEVLNWLEQNRAALLAGQVGVENITSINVPTCDPGSIRGRAEVPLATTKPDYVPSLDGQQDCESTLTDPSDDVEAFFNGYVAITPVPRNSSRTCER